MALGSVSFSSGFGSGIDFGAIVDALINAQSQPITTLKNRVAGFNAAKSSINQLSGLLSDFETKLETLSGNTAVGGKTVTLSSTNAPFTAKADSTALNGAYAVTISQLAQATRIRSAGFADSSTATVADGAITMQAAGHDAITVNVSAASGNNTLDTIAADINGRNAGIQASIINNGTSSILVVKSESTGTDHALTISSDTSGLHLTGDGTENPTPTLQAAQNAKVTVDGIEITSQTNTVATAIDGVTLTLNGKTTSTYTLTVGNDVEGTKTALNELVAAYNKINDYFQANFGSKDALNNSPVATQATVRNLQYSLQAVISQSVSGIDSGKLDSLSVIGIGVADKTGKLSFDEEKFDDLVEQGRFDEISDVIQTKGLVGASGYHKGWADMMVDVIDTMTNPIDGTIASLLKSYDDSIKTSNDKITALTDSLTSRRELLTKQFAAAEQAISQLQSMQSQMQQQLKS